MIAAVTDAVREAERQVRDPHLFKWYAVALLALVIYAYAVEVERGRWDVIACGLAVWLADWFNELVNAIVLGASGVAPLWVSTGPTAYQFLVGLNVEISFMFILAGIVYAKLLTAIPSRFWLALGLSVTSVLVELFLHASGTFHWHYWWWNVATFPVIVVFGYLWFYLYAAWVYDAPTPRKRWRRLGGLAGVNLVLALVAGLQGWL